jgi:hypothetical protein
VNSKQDIRPKDSTDKEPTFPYQNLKVWGQLLYLWLTMVD